MSKKATVKSSYEDTISFSAEGFDSLLSKEWDELVCNMSNGAVIYLPRYKVTQLWAAERKWRKVPHSTVLIKVLVIT